MFEKQLLRARGVRRKMIAVVSGASLVLGATFVVGAGVVAAQGGCGGTSVDLSGSRLLNDGVANVAGPFQVNLAAGTYDVTAISYDAHSTVVTGGDQSMEQWSFVLDSGYQSPLTADIADSSDWSTSTWGGQQIDGATSLKLVHRGAGGVNSVDPVCIGFVRIDSELPDPATTVAASDDPATDDQIADEPDAADLIAEDPADAIDTTSAATEPDDADFASTAPAVDPVRPGDAQVTDPADIIAEVEGIVELPGDAIEQLRQASSAADTARTDQTRSAPETKPLSAAQVEEIPVLALTGPTLTETLVLIALALIAVGCGIMAGEELKAFDERRGS